MSRLSPDRLLLSLEPSALSWVRLAGVLKPRIVAKGTVAADGASGAAPWQGAVDALRRQAEAWRKEPLRVTAVLSNHFVRYLMVPPAAGASGHAEGLALARFHFTKVHGERAKAWEVRLAPDRAGAQRLASAVDTALVESLKACFPDRARLVSIQPYLMSAFNLWREQVPKDGAWLLLSEPRQTCLALLAKGAWTAVQNSRANGASPEEWTELLEREKLRAGGESIPATVLVRSAARVTAATPVPGSWKFLGLGSPALPGFMPLDDDRYVMALTAR